jgi:hypothetical protein
MSEEMTREQACNTLRNAAWLGTNEDRERIERAVELLCGEPGDGRMKLIIDISKDRYDEIMAMDWRNCRRFFDEEIRAIHDGMPQRTGHWITVTNRRGGHECSLCHVYAPSYKNGDEWLTKYCPKCGCRMVDPQEESEG